MPWKCPKCGFVLHKMFLRASDGAVGIDLSTAREVCPNDGTTLLPMEEQQEDKF